MLRLRTFGGLSLEDGRTGSPGRTAQRRRLALLAVLAANRHRPISRDRLVALFWPDRGAEEARHSLAQLVYGVRQELGDQLVLTGADDLRSNAELLSADVVDFEDALDRGDLEAAEALYAGPFLDGFYAGDAAEFERWAEEERARLARRFAVALETLARGATRAGSATDAVKWWRRRAALDPLDASVAMELMRALAAAGDRAGAIRHAGIHESLMRSELDAPADAAVATLAERLRHDVDVVTPVPAPKPADVPVSAAPSASREPNRARRLTPSVIGALTLAVVAVVAFVVRRGDSAAPAPPALVVLGAIDGPDSTLTFAVREALRSGLEADPKIHVLGESRTRETLHLMARTSDARLTGPVAAEVALRRGAAFAVVGSVIPVGGGIQIVAEALNPRTGEAVLTVSEHADAADQAIPAIARIGERLRKKASGARSEHLSPLPSVMTSSLEALQDYALARRALARFDRGAAMRFGEAALEQDSTFPMAHYLVADLDWFSDRQRDCERHLTQALALKDRLTLRERLLVQARYAQIVADNSDSALTYWQRLHAAYLDDGQAFEGMAWTYRAMGRYREAAAAADSALMLDSTTFAPSGTNKMFALIDAGDTSAALAYARKVPANSWWIEAQARYLTAIRARDWRRALAAYPDTTPSSQDPKRPTINPYHHLALLMNGRVNDAAALVPGIRRVWADHQFAPRAILAQARVELARGRPAASATAAREVLAWTEAADLSAPAVARLTERTVELAARAGDQVTIAAARRLVERRDAGRKLPSYHLALLAVDAAAAFARGDMRTAANFAEAARQGMYHGRSLAPLALLEADARAALGERDAARELYRRLLTPDAFAAGDLEIWPIYAQEAEARLAKWVSD